MRYFKSLCKRFDSDLGQTRLFKRRLGAGHRPKLAQRADLPTYPRENGFPCDCHGSTELGEPNRTATAGFVFRDGGDDGKTYAF